MSASPVITKCNELKDTTGSEKTTILTLAQDDSLNGQFFTKKNVHWSWWVFPSATGNPKYAQFNFDDNAPIYQDIANKNNYLDAYTKVLGYITEEIKHKPATIAQNIDLTKVMRCYYRIHLQTQNKTNCSVFNDQFIKFCDEIKKYKNTILDRQKKYYSKYYNENKKLVENCCNFSNKNTLPSILPELFITPQTTSFIPNNQSVYKPIFNYTKNTQPQTTITNPVNNQYLLSQQPTATNPQPPIQQKTNKTHQQNKIFARPTFTPTVQYYSKNSHNPQPTLINTTYDNQTQQTNKNKITAIDVLLCILLPVIWWIVVAKKIKNNKANKNLQTIHINTNKIL